MTRFQSRTDEDSLRGMADVNRQISQYLSDRIPIWTERPSIMVRELFETVPDPWQEEILDAYPHNQRVSMTACKGPGKTCVLAWIAWNFLLCCPMVNIPATSISGDNLKDGLWKEMNKWRLKSPIVQHLFEWTNTRIVLKSHPANHWMSARTWPKTGDAEQQAQTLAGIHEDFVLFILDEAGSIPDSVMAAAEAALASCKRGHIVIAGNPTMLSGPLYRAATNEKHLWYRKEITGDPDDPSRASRVSEVWARQQIEKYGRDHPFVLVNVFGRFPPQSLTSLIGPDEVRAAMNRYYRDWEIGDVAKVMGIDVARQGDDESVIARRHGIQMLPFKSYRNVPNGIVGASIANREWHEFGADACFVDATGGLGFTWLDQMAVLGRAGIPVQFSSKASDDRRYANKRAQIYFDFVDWIKRGGALPPMDGEGSDKLLRALCETQVTFHKDRLILEDKDDIKSRLGFSPDHADAGALTFSEPVTAAPRRGGVTRNQSVVTPYSPFGELERNQAMGRSAAGIYDPFSSR